MYSLVLHGRKSLELHKWGLLKLGSALYRSVSLESQRWGLVQNFSSASSSDDKRKNESSVLYILRKYGFTDPQISGMVKSYPGLLRIDADKSVAPKLEFLQSRGATGPELGEILSIIPKILGMKGLKTSSLYYDFVKHIMTADKGCELEVFFPSSVSCKQKNVMRNIWVLRELGVPHKRLFSLLSKHHKLVSGVEKFERSLKTIVDLGMDSTKETFVDALRVICGLSDQTIEKKLDVYRSTLGLSVEDVWNLFKKYPPVLRLSEENIVNTTQLFIGLGYSRDEFAMMVKTYPSCITSSAESVKKKTEFLVKKMNWPVAALSPVVLGYSMEKRIIPRCNVVKALLSKGLLASELPPILSVLVCTDQVFLNRYVISHDDKELVSELKQILAGVDRAGS